MAQNWWVQDYGLNILPGNATTGGGGNLGNIAAAGAVQFRDPLDARRAAAGRIGQAEYPDGYLGNIPWDRRRDRMAVNVAERLTARSYQRGVHRGAQVSPKDYFWPGDQPGPEDGIARQMASVRVGNVMIAPRFASRGNPVEYLAHQGRTAGMATPEALGSQLAEMRSMGIDPANNPIIPQDPESMRKMMPRYGTFRKNLGTASVGNSS